MCPLNRFFAVIGFSGLVLLNGCATCEEHPDGCRVVAAVAIVAVGFAIAQNVHIHSGPSTIVNPAPPGAGPCNSSECVK